MKSKISFLRRFFRQAIFALVLFLGITEIHSQSDLCGYNGLMDSYEQSNPGFLQQMMTDEQEIQQAMQTQGNEGSGLYVIPVVFHVLHMAGEPVGSGSNISNAQIEQALIDLNSDFRNSNTAGYDVEIEFCLAQQDPFGNSIYDSGGNNITGIQRVNASGVSQFDTYGIWSGVNEIAAKALSNWPEDDYVNIWIAHRLYVPDNDPTTSDDAAGFAYFPAAGDAVDGIALRSDATGVPGNSKVITHEAGHFFALYHTFQDGDDDCPTSTGYDCSQQGDMICETRTHGTFSFPFPCTESLYASCDPGYSGGYNVIENHMNYTDNNCRNEFVPEQATRMRCTLVMLRGSLTTSIGCTPGCNTVTSSYSVIQNEVGIGTNVSFTNTSVGGNSFTWLLDGEILSTATDWSFQFDEGGTYQVCLDTEETSGCIQRYCDEIIVIPTCIPFDDPCQLPQNCNFEQISSTSLINDFENVCGWVSIQSSPYFCDDINNSVGIWLSGTSDVERVTSDMMLDLPVGAQCELKFDYLVSSYLTSTGNPQSLLVALTDNITPMDINSPLEPSATIIGQVSNPPTQYSGQNNNQCPQDGFTWETYTGNFQTIDVDNQYLTFTGIGGNNGVNIVFFDNVCLNCCGTSSCTPIPDFTFDPDCPNEFIGTNTGDGDGYTWTFLCTDVTYNGQNVAIDLPPGECEVCLTVACDQEFATTVCKTVTIPDETPECENLCQDINVPIIVCEQDTSASNSFITEIDLAVPEGTAPCDGVDVISGIGGYSIESSYVINDDADPLQDIITIGLNITTPPGVNLINEGAIGVINLCDSLGNVLCYDLTYFPTQCPSCGGEINAVAECIDDNIFDDNYVYAGSVSFTIPDYYKPCDGASSEAGYDQSVTVDQGTGETTVDFVINTSNDELSHVSTLLCFQPTVGGGVQICYTLNIQVETCIDPPTDCLDWAGKVFNASNCRVDGDQVIYDVGMPGVNLFSPGYGFCDGQDIVGNIEGGGTVDVTYADFNNDGSEFDFAAEVTMPCDLDINTQFIMTLYACNDRGEYVCFEFNIEFPDCDVDCNRDDRDKVGLRSDHSVERQEVDIYPNPATHSLTVNINNLELNAGCTIVMMDYLGKLVYKVDVRDAMTLVDLNQFQSGIYLIKVIAEEDRVIDVERLSIIK